MVKRTAICRGDGFVSIRYSFLRSDLPSKDVEARVTLPSGRGLPSCESAMEIERQSGLLVIFPNVDVSRYEVILSWIDSDGSERTFKDSVSSFHAKWESRIRYRLDEQSAYEIRPYADQVYRCGTNVVIANAVPSVDTITFHFEIRSLTCKSPSLRLYDEAFREVEANPIMMGNEAIDFLGQAMWLTQFSCKVPTGIKGVCGCAYDERDELLSFGGMVPVDELIDTQREKTRTAWDCVQYEKWHARHRIPTGLLDRFESGSSAVDEGARFIIVVLGAGDENALKGTLSSVRGQIYANRTVIIASSSIDSPLCADENDCEFLAAHDLPSYLSAMEGRESYYLCLLREGNMLEADMLLICARRIGADPSIDMIYFDEDVTLADGRTYPLFKSDYNPELLHCRNYIGDGIVLRVADAQKALMNQVEDAMELCYRVTLKLEGSNRNILHIPRIGKHVFLPEGDYGSYVASQVSAEAVHDHLIGMGQDADVLEVANPVMTKVRFNAPQSCPLVSIVIPSKDNVDVLSTCIESILSKTAYPHYEIVIVENNSEFEETFSYYESIVQDERGNVRVIEWPYEFNFSKIINYGCQHAHGEYFLLLNNDTELIHEDWLDMLVGSASRDGIGAVGVKLFYPDDTVQHAGVKIGDQGALHLNYGLYKDDAGYYDLSCLAQNLSAVTAACMITSRVAFEEVGGFTEELAVAYNDVDYCLKLREAGYRIVYEPTVTLYHYESLTRGSDAYGNKGARLIAESAYMLSRWPAYYSAGDPFYNKNLQGVYYGL